MEFFNFKKLIKKKLLPLEAYQQFNLLLRDSELYRQEYLYRKIKTLHTSSHHSSFGLEPVRQDSLCDLG